MSVRDTGWREGERQIGRVVLHAIQYDTHCRARVWFLAPDRALLSMLPTTHHDSLDAARLSAEDALRRLCRDTLAALGETP